MNIIIETLPSCICQPRPLRGGLYLHAPGHLCKDHTCMFKFRIYYQDADIHVAPQINLQAEWLALTFRLSISMATLRRDVLDFRVGH